MIHPSRSIAARLALSLLAVGLAATVVPASAASASVQGVDPETDLPAGFTDGVPVTGADGTADGSVPGQPADDTDEATTSATRAAGDKYFGADPWNAIKASAAATTRSCAISNNGLTALTVSPVFKESSAATSSSTAPSPMTLSRYDEWSGVKDTNTNANANYGLYAFRSPTTAYPRAYWHPGIGIWQYDSAGVGAPFTAIERMDVRTVSADVAKGMAARYCNPSTSLIGHGAPFTSRERRNAAWAPWGYPCNLCEQEFQAMTGSGAAFSNINLVSGISVTGGAKARSCSLAGVAGTLRCWYIDPSVGTIEGATGWATVNPGGGSPTVAPAPLAKPFYVLERNGREERHWLRADTGYAIDIAGTRQLGKNERPRANQAGSGITWTSSSSLCDLTTGRGSCVPIPPAGVTGTPIGITATYRPISLDADGDGRGDVLWYAPGAGSDRLWLGRGSGTFTGVGLSVGGTYDIVRPLDVDGDGDDDILWYQPSTGASYLWRSKGDGTFTVLKLNVAKKLIPLVVDRDGDGRDEILWYGPGSLTDRWYRWTGSSFLGSAATISGTYAPLIGDFDGNGRDDIFWYGPGSARDVLWLHSGAGTIVSKAVSISGRYQPVIGDFDGNRSSDIFWYAPGTASDRIWWGGPGAAFAGGSTTVSSTFRPVIADLEGDGRDDILWYAPGPARDTWWRWTAGRAVAGTSFEAAGQHRPVVVAGSGTGGSDGILWYAAGAAPDSFWWR